MNKLLLCVLCVLASSWPWLPCFADTVNGVLAEERVVNLPQDQDKWYISVVGDANDARYNEVLGWFDSNPSLAKLKNQVHVLSRGERHADLQGAVCRNVKGLPTVRMQKPDGTVVYEAAGKNLPMTAAGLNGALAGAVNEAQGLRPDPAVAARCGQRPECNLEHPEPQPQPQPDPEPQPIDDGGTPDRGAGCVALPGWLLAPICGAAGSVAGLCLGYGKKLKEKLTPARARSSLVRFVSCVSFVL